jgi:hypothetical protein
MVPACLKDRFAGEEAGSRKYKPFYQEFEDKGKSIKRPSTLNFIKIFQITKKKFQHTST